jgi:putative ABC transport system permease protein
MKTLSQTLVISWMNLKNITTRLGSSLVIVIGIGGVVAVLVSLLSMANGFESTMKGTGRAARVLVLREGSTSEINGNMPLNQYAIISNKTGVAKIDDEPVAAMETFVTVKLKERAGNEVSSLPMRGVGEKSFLVRPELAVVKGRMLEYGKYELLAGAGAALRIDGLDVGRTITIRGDNWLVVGHFSTAGSAYESELWADERLLAELHNRGNTFSSMLVQLNSEQDFDSFRDQVVNDRQLAARVLRESDYYSAQAKDTTVLIRGVGLLVGSIMSIGAVFAAFNTMYSALSTRTVEIATLKALGFSRGPIFLSVLVESMLLGLLGGMTGGLITYLTLNGYTVSTAGGTFTQVNFDFMVTAELLVSGIFIAVVLGLIGGTIPAMSAVRRPIVIDLRKT